MTDPFSPGFDVSAISKMLETSIADRQRVEHERAGRFDAELIFNSLIEKVSKFEDQLSQAEEIGVRLANFGVAAEIHIRAISYQNPNLITFDGLDPLGNRVELTQHIGQLNFMLTALAPIVEDEPYRVGFNTKASA